ncbi:hypothetical protein ACFV4N_31615 [Actinosynnema sp. NPDC059797]
MRIRWGGEPRPEDVPGISCLHLRPSPARLREPALPELVELTVLNSRKVVNARALLDCPTPAGVTFVDCGNPFKGGGKALFEARGFAHLDIDWS